jgi:hypothetical protein
LFGRKEEDCVDPIGDTQFALHHRCTSLLISGTQRRLRSGSCCNFLYCDMVCLVTGWTTLQQCSSMLMMGPVH